VIDACVQYLGYTYAENPALWMAASPAYHVSARSAPFLFLHGEADTAVPYAESLAMIQTLRAAGVHAELFSAPGAKHGFFNWPPWYEPTLERITQFFSETLQRPNAKRAGRSPMPEQAGRVASERRAIVRAGGNST